MQTWSSSPTSLENSARSIAAQRRRVQVTDVTPDAVWGTTGLPNLRADVLARLNRRTRHRAIRAEHAAIPRLRPEAFPATLAVIEDLASVARHLLGCLMPALRARDGGLRDQVSLAAVSFAAQARRRRTSAKTTSA